MTCRYSGPAAVMTACAVVVAAAIAAAAILFMSCVDPVRLCMGPDTVSGNNPPNNAVAFVAGIGPPLGGGTDALTAGAASVCAWLTADLLAFPFAALAGFLLGLGGGSSKSTVPGSRSALTKNF